MKRIKNFRLFEGAEDVEEFNRHPDLGRDARQAVKYNNFEEFKNAVDGLDRIDLSSVLKWAAEYGRVEFVEYLIDNNKFTNDEINSAINWVGHSIKAKNGIGDDVDRVLDILNGLTGRRF